MNTTALAPRPAPYADAERHPGSRPTVSVDLGAVAANTRLLSRRTGAELMAVVKADGFGLGAVDVARTALASGATRLGVTSLEEAFALRAAGITAPVLSWLNAVGADVGRAAAEQVEVAVPGLAHLQAVVDRAPGARVHLHLDTGMARDGAEPQAWPALCRAAALAERRGMLTVVGVMGHLACADEPGRAANRAGRERFAWGVGVATRLGLRPRHRHLAATAALLTDPGSHHTMVRVGAGLVGIDPTGTTTLHGALTVTAPLVTVRSVPRGTPVGYGHTWRSATDTRLGLVALGYADGLPRAASGRAEVLVGGVRRPVVGRVSMDQVVVDLGRSTAREGDVVTVMGPGASGEPTVADWARWSDTLPHEVVTGLGRRPHRVVVPAGTTGGRR